MRSMILEAAYSIASPRGCGPRRSGSQREMAPAMAKQKSTPIVRISEAIASSRFIWLPSGPGIVKGWPHTRRLRRRSQRSTPPIVFWRENQRSTPRIVVESHTQSTGSSFNSLASKSHSLAVRVFQSEVGIGDFSGTIPWNMSPAPTRAKAHFHVSFAGGAAEGHPVDGLRYVPSLPGRRLTTKGSSAPGRPPSTIPVFRNQRSANHPERAAGTA